MQLDGTTTIIILAVIIVFYAVYATQSIQKKIYCTFHRVDGTRIDRWCKHDQARVEFDGGWYYINPHRLATMTWDKGIFALFPTKIQCAEWKFDSNQMLDPKTFTNDYEKPEDRLHLDKTEDLKAMYEGNRKAIQSGSVKQGAFQQYLPFIVIIGFLVVGYFIYTLMAKTDLIGNGQNVIESMLGELLKKP